MAEPLRIEHRYRLVLSVQRRDGESLSHGPGLRETDIDVLRNAFRGDQHPVRLPIPLHPYGLGGLAIRLDSRGRSVFVELLVEKGKTPDDVLRSAELALEGTPLLVSR